MAGIVGAFNINDNSGSVSFGNIVNVSPKRVEKSFHGSGGGNIGNLVNEVSGLSFTNTVDITGVEQPITGNA